MNFIKKLNNAISDLLIAVTVLLLAFIMVLIVSEVVLRGLFRKNLDWVIEINRLLFQWIVYLGAAYGIHKKTHIKFEFANKFKGKIRKTMIIIEQFFDFVFFLILIIFGYKMMIVGRTNMYSTLKLTYLWTYMPVFVMGVLSILFTIETIIELASKNEL